MYHTSGCFLLLLFICRLGPLDDLEVLTPLVTDITLVPGAGFTNLLMGTYFL